MGDAGAISGGAMITNTAKIDSIAQVKNIPG
jgi:hypothetical protein